MGTLKLLPPGEASRRPRSVAGLRVAGRMCPLLSSEWVQAGLPLVFAVPVEIRITKYGDQRRDRASGGRASQPGRAVDPSTDFLQDRAATSWYGGTPVRPTDVVAESVDAYVPAAVDPTVWAEVGPLARAWAGAVPASSGRQAVNRMKPLAQFLGWRHRVGASSTDPEVVFRADDIERFIHVGCAHLSDGTRSTYRSALRTIGEHVVGTEVACPDRTVALSGSEIEPPYSDAELAALLTAIEGQRTAHRRHNALVIVTYALGAGLRAGDIALLVGDDHEVRGDGTVILRVPGPRSRIVVVRRRWEDHAARFAELTGSRPVFRSSRTKIGHREIGRFCERPLSIDAPRLSAARLRATWLVEHLAMGTPLPTLAEAAGVTPTQIGRYAAFLPQASDETAIRRLRGNAG